MASHLFFSVGFVLNLAMFSPSAFSQQNETDPTADPPRWFHEHMEFMTQGNGRWITDNAAYQNADEPYEEYGTEWRWGLGKKSMTGRLFGLIDGKEVGDFWEFRAFWHPGEMKVYVHQYAGHGVVGIGTMDSTAEKKTLMDQVFFNMDGTQMRVGHESWDMKTGEHETQSFDINEDGVWKKRRLYIWTQDS